jgi:phage portal protein BeeE
MQPDNVGDVNTITVNTQFMNATYRAKDVQRRKRYYHGTDNEIWHVFTFNPDRGTQIYYGTPIAKPLYYDIEQYIASGTHNRSLLLRGARPGGTFSHNGEVPLTDKQFKRMQDQIDQYYVGANNAGRPLFLENIEYTEHIVHNKDMDYATLVANARSAIYRQFRIPLPLVESSTMTHNNYETAQVALYEKAVLSVTDKLYEQLTLALMYRYEEDWQRYELAYDKASIPALQLRQTETVKTKKQINVHTINELRADFGDEPLPGGDVLMRPSNEIPALEEDGIPPQGEPASEEEQEKRMREAVDHNGNPRFTDEQIRRALGK